MRRLIETLDGSENKWLDFSVHRLLEIFVIES